MTETSGAKGRWSDLYKPYTNTPAYADGSWQKSKGYSFRVVTAENIKTDAGGFKEFPLQINPQELQQDEVFAIKVTPTLRGVLVEHQGVLIKDIVINGTTGISPKRREGGADSNTGKPILATGHSGFEEFQELRSYFRAYAEAKRVDYKGTLRMLFINRKDGEAIFVEPQKFSMKRSSSKPFMYDYSIILKGIGNAQLNDGMVGPPDVDSVLESVDKAINQVSRGVQIVNGAVGLIQRTERDIVNAVLEPARLLNSALQAIKAGQEANLTPFGITRRFVDTLNREVQRVEANLNEIYGKAIGQYNQMTGRTPTLVNWTGRQPTYEENKVLNGLNSIKKACINTLSQASLFSNNQDLRFDNVENAYQSRSVDQNGDPIVENSGNVRLLRPTSVDTTKILGNDTIQTIAARILGNPDRYREIVVLNNLKPPYIAETASSGVLAYGDSILIPATGSIDKSSGVVLNKDYEITKDLDYSKKALGVDIMIDDDYDLKFANFGDYDLVAGIENMAQAILLKIYYENGSLKRHPGIGASLRVGRKVTDLGIARVNLLNSLNADNRVESVPYLSLQQEGNTTKIVAVIRLKGIDQPVPVTVEV